MNVGVTASSESKALRLARYLKEFVGLRSTTVYDLNKYESVLWFSDMPQERECRSPAGTMSFRGGRSLAGGPQAVVLQNHRPWPETSPAMDRSSSSKAAPPPRFPSFDRR